jgi:hypothetical protein
MHGSMDLETVAVSHAPRMVKDRIMAARTITRQKRQQIYAHIKAKARQGCAGAWFRISRPRATTADQFKLCVSRHFADVSFAAETRDGELFILVRWASGPVLADSFWFKWAI